MKVTIMLLSSDCNFPVLLRYYTWVIGSGASWKHDGDTIDAMGTSGVIHFQGIAAEKSVIKPLNKRLQKNLY